MASATGSTTDHASGCPARSSRRYDSLSHFTQSWGVDMDRPVAEGGQAMVYLDSEGNRVVKVIMRKRGHLDHPALYWPSLKPHPNILTCLAVCIFDIYFVTVSPRLRCNARALVQRCPHVDRTSLLLGTARGLAYLHDNGLEHGDIKGFNILIGYDGNAVIGDLEGLQKGTEAHTESSTPHWIAPEMFSDAPRPLGSRDIWSLACTVIELYTDETPFPGIPLLFGAHDYLRDNNPYATCPDIARRRGLSPALWLLVREMLSFDPFQRPTANQVVDALETLVTTECDHFSTLEEFANSDPAVS